MKKADQIAGIVLLIFSGFIMEESWRMPDQAIAGRTFFGPGVGFLPFWTGAFIAFLSILLIVNSSLRPSGPTQKAVDFPRGQALISVVLIPVSLGAYIFLLDILGYLVSTLLFLVFLARVVLRAKWKLTFVVAVLASVSLYSIFQLALHVPLPKNMFGF